MPDLMSPLPSALTAYARAVDQSRAVAVPPGGPSPAESFGALLERTMSDAVGAGERAEAASFSALSGRVPLQDLIEHVNEAEMSLQTVVAVRDRLISAYQEIMRMPI